MAARTVPKAAICAAAADDGLDFQRLSADRHGEHQQPRARPQGLAGDRPLRQLQGVWRFAGQGQQPQVGVQHRCHLHPGKAHRLFQLPFQGRQVATVEGKARGGCQVLDLGAPQVKQESLAVLEPTPGGETAEHQSDERHRDRGHQ